MSHLLTLYLAISSSLLAEFNLFGQYAAAAYCSENNNSPRTKVVCPYGNCPLVEAASTNSTHEFQKYVALMQTSE